MKEEYDENISWTVGLNGYILKIIPILQSEMMWVISSEENVFLVDTKNGKTINLFKNLGEFIFSAVIHPTSNELFVTSSKGVLSLSTQGAIIPLIEEKNWFEHIAISDDGSIIFAANGKTLYILEYEENRYHLVSQDSSFSSTISDIIFNIDSFLVSNYGGVREYKAKDFQNYQVYEWKTSLLITSWSPDKKYIAAGTQENAIHFWPYPFKEENDFQISGYPAKVTKIIWANNATEFVVNCSEDVHIWDFSNGPPTGKMPITLQCGFGKIADIVYKGNLLIAASEAGFIFYFIPSNAETFLQMHSVENDITCISMNEVESELYVGTKAGQLYCLEINI
jgi:WD40 repeat protein